jgi:soluble lytic murein transglycosylase-like protein
MGGKTTTSTNQVTIPQDVLDRYNAINAQAAKVAENPFQKYGTKPEDFVAQFNEQQLKGVQGINDVAGMGPVYENIDKYLNPYTKNVADTTRAQMEQAQEQAQSGALGTAVSSGAFGGDRAGVAAANLANQNQMAMGSTMANIYNQGYTQAVDTSMNDRNRMLGVAGAQLGAGTQMQQTEQAGKDALINQFMQEQGYPFQVAQFLANIATSTGALSGSTTTTTQPAQIFSDRRLKHDIKKIGEADNGLPIYTFKYKGDEHHQTHVGFMADEVEKKNPDAVGLDPSGYKTVDYEKAAQSMGGAVKSFADGGVAGPYGSKVGQGVGVGSYVPQAYLPVGELMVADPAVATAHQSGIADALESAAAMGKSVAEIRDLLNKNARGGVVGYAGGGGVEPKLHGDYLSSTLAAQEAGKDKPELMTAKPAEKQESALGNIASTLGSIASIASIFSDRRLKHDIKRIGKTEKGLPIYTFKYKGDDREQTHVGFMADEVERDHPEAVGKRDGYKTVDYSQAHKFADGGVAGRHGYALDGAVDERLRDAMREAAGVDNGMRLTRDEVPAAQTLGSLPDARVVTAEAAPSAEEESARAYRAAAANRFNGLAPAADDVRPMARPTGLVPAADTVAPTVEQRPMARPAGLVPAAVVKPVARPEGLEAFATGYGAARNHFRTNILTQESGNRQFDENGQPLTSPKGATGIAQVMKATGPEAADLANLAWDEDRWKYDADYNAAIGEAYFLDQYRKFGSIDKASAAYNAGPGALQEAMSKAETLGGSYLDYLPAETQNYVKSTTGISGGAGSNGLAGGAGGDTLGTQEGGLKPYDERNTLGKMVYDKDGKVNKNAMLSLFAGLGDMLSSPSPFLLPAIGAGISGAAKTYMAREEQLADIENKKLDAMKKVSDETIRYNNRYRTNYTTAEYEAMALDINTPPPDNSRVSDMATYGGVPLDPFGGSLNELMDAGNGTFIRAADSLQYNERLLAAQQSLLASGSIDAQTVANTAAQIEEIKARNGVVPVLNADGSQKVDANGSPVYTTDSTVSRIEQARVAQVEGDKLKATVGDRIAASETASTAVDNMVESIVAAGDRQGILAPIREIVSGVAQELNLGTGNFRALQNEMDKARANFISANGQLTDMARDITGASLPNLSNEAAANAYVAATMQAYYEREAQVLSAIEAARSPQEAYTANIDKYAKFDMKAATEKYYKENLERMSVADPTSAEAINPPAPDGSPAPDGNPASPTEGSLADNGDGNYGVYRNGAWVRLTKEQYEAELARNQ